MTLNDRIGILANLGEALQKDNDAKRFAIGKANYENKWFTEPEVSRMINAVSEHYLNYDRLHDFSKKYPITDIISDVKTVGMIPAGNIPMVGFHDLLCTLLSGHQGVIKMSEKDQALMPWVMQVLEGISLEMARQVTFVNKLQGFDAVIATGSNNSAQIFQRYFGQYPHIIRNNKTGVAVLTGKETEDELGALAADVFSYFGLGCRNISKIYVPQNYDFKELGEVLNTYKEIVLHSKYKNNFDYNLAVTMLNKDTFINVASIILIEKEDLHSRIASLHYEYYKDADDVAKKLSENEDRIQVITGQLDLTDMTVLPLGSAQRPALDDYADGIDTMDFLVGLN